MLSIALLLSLTACSTPVAPTPAPAPPAAPAEAPAVEPPAEPSKPAAGAYSASAVDDEAKAAAAFAVGQLGRKDVTLASVDAAERQVVAGMNYKLDLTLSDGSRWRVVVYRSLDAGMTLTSSEPIPAP